MKREERQAKIDQIIAEYGLSEGLSRIATVDELCRDYGLPSIRIGLCDYCEDEKCRAHPNWIA